MLEVAGVVFHTKPASVDESEIKKRLLSRDRDRDPASLAAALACAKAEAVSRICPDAVIIGSDQVLVCDGAIYSKPGTRSSARQMLQDLKGRKHALHSSVALAEHGQTTWLVTDTALLTMYAFSDAVLDRYLEAAGDGILACAGAYQIEGAGVRLFDRIEGDHFTILGMPLIPLLAELRMRGVLPA